jgi:predicted ArsR family transcriptional regulator
VCAYEKRLFETVLGMRLDRVEHLASGGRACVYCPARAKASTAASAGRGAGR